MARNGYSPTGPTWIKNEFWYWGQIPKGYRVHIEVRDLLSTKHDNNYVWTDGYHKVVVTGPQPRPRSKAFIGESAWCNAERYAGDCVAQLQRNQRRNPNSPHFCETGGS